MRADIVRHTEDDDDIQHFFVSTNQHNLTKIVNPASSPLIIHKQRYPPIVGKNCTRVRYYCFINFLE